MIRKRGRRWQVVAKDGERVLGEHATRAAALEQLRAVEARKARAKRKSKRGKR